MSQGLWLSGAGAPAARRLAHCLSDQPDQCYRAQAAQIAVHPASLPFRSSRLLLRHVAIGTPACARVLLTLLCRRLALPSQAELLQLLRRPHVRLLRRILLCCAR